MAAAAALALAWAQPAGARAGHSTAALRRTEALQRAQDVPRAVCGRRVGGRARCMAVKLVPRSAQAVAPSALANAQTSVTAPAAPSPAAGEFGLRPEDLHSAYQLPTSAVDSQTIALVDAYNDPDAEADLASFSNEFGLPACTTANGCFEQLNQEGESGDPPFPKTVKELEAALKSSKRAEVEEAEEAIGWSVEMSLDIETAHAVCQSCHIALVEADTPSYGDLEAAEKAAASAGAQEISNSWGGPECATVGDCISSSAFDHPGAVITAAAGDEGYLGWLEEGGPSFANYPASSPQVVAVGGTRLALGADGEWAGETVWNDGGESEGEKGGVGATGGGCSAEFTAPAWQQAVADWPQVGCGDKRAVSDVSADADPYSGVAVYDSLEECGYLEGKAVRYSHWCTIGGTSLATPLIAATFALVGGATGVEYPARTLYENVASSPGALHDVTEGSNGECLHPFDEETGVSSCTAAEEAANSCASQAICLARSGYDGPSGLGTPDGLSAFEHKRQPTVSTGEASQVTQTSAELNASVTPNWLTVSACKFEYGRASVSEASAPCAAMPGAGGSAETASAQVTGLSANTTYRFRVVATNADGTSTGETQTFTTLPYTPTVEAGGEASVQDTAATVHARVNPNGSEVSECVFQYRVAGTSGDGYEGSAPCTPAPGAGSDPVAVSASLTGLQPNTSYRYRVLARNAGGVGEGAEQTFSTPSAPPTVLTGTSSEITQTSATLAGSVNPNGVEVSACKFEYGTASVSESSAPCEPTPGASRVAEAVSARASGLSANTTYSFRVVATNADGTSTGETQTFTTLPHPPTVEKSEEASVQETSATVYASVNPNGGAVSECVVRYGKADTPTGVYEANAPCTPAPGAGSDAVAVSASLTGLQPNTSYHYRVLARNSGGVGEGGEQTFITLAAPTVITGAAAEITQTSATLGGSINPNGQPVTTCEIEYGTSTAYGLSVSCESGSPLTGDGAVAVSAPIRELTAGTTYYFRVSATSAVGTEYGDPQTFTTDLPTALVHQPLGQSQESPSTQIANSTQGSNTGGSSRTPTASASTKRPAPNPDARLAATSLRATPAGVVLVKVSCPATETSCTGTVTLRTLSAVPIGVDKKTHKTAILTLASGSFDVAGGHVTAVKLHLSARARALLLLTHSLRAQATVFARDPARATHTTLEFVTIHAGRPAAAHGA